VKYGGYIMKALACTGEITLNMPFAPQYFCVIFLIIPVIILSLTFSYFLYNRFNPKCILYTFNESAFFSYPILNLSYQIISI